MKIFEMIKEQNSYVKLPIYFAFVFTFIWSLFQLAGIYIFGIRGGFLPFYSLYLVFGYGYLINVIIFAFIGFLLGLFSHLFNKKWCDKNYLRLALLISLFFSLIFLIRLVIVTNASAGEGWGALFALKFVIMGIPIGFVLSFSIFSPIILSIKGAYANLEENSRKTINKIAICTMFIVIVLYLLSSLFNYSAIAIAESSCQGLPKPRSIDLSINEIKVFEDYLILSGAGLPNKKEVYDNYAIENGINIEENGYAIFPTYDDWGNYRGTTYDYYYNYNLTVPWLLALKKTINNETLEYELVTKAIGEKRATQDPLTLDDLINNLAYTQANTKGSPAPTIGAQGELSDYIDRKGISAEKLTELFSNVCFPEESRAYFIALADNRAGRDYYSLDDVRLIVKKAKESVKYFRDTKNIQRAEWNINHMDYYVYFVSGGYGRYGNRTELINGLCCANTDCCLEGGYEDIMDNSTHVLWSCRGLNGGLNVNCSGLIR
ncbi:hypothetical protein J4217_00635 [Candidatus Pacearchaeota archaeon]|nr:hypothetical protein [Candidatus Pacearchaeota archaeon]